jgi:hypothetical protein
MTINTFYKTHWKDTYLIVQELKARIISLDKFNNPKAVQVKEDLKDLLCWITDNQVEFN